MKAYDYRQLGLENLALVKRDEPQAAAQEVVVIGSRDPEKGEA